MAKRRDSRYEPGERSGSWAKMRVNQSQDFVIGGYTVGGGTFDALIFGYNGLRLLYGGRTRSVFTAAARESLMRQFHGLEISDCPFANLPEARAGRWGEGLTAGEDEKLAVAEASARGALRIRRVDARQAPAGIRGSWHFGRADFPAPNPSFELRTQRSMPVIVLVLKLLEPLQVIG